ncbi:MAG: aminotransferase class IV [Bacteroidales bacterium]|jgi:branched-chain amino acid aminotransferase|nr:aminotransferase class IV [Bacteroidales bacterium]
MECFQKYYIHNNKIQTCDNFNEDLLKLGVSVYEVIRIENGVAIFVDDHLERLFNSANILKLKISEDSMQIKSTIRKLIEINRTKLGKIKILIHFDSVSKMQQNILFYFNPHHFPTAEELSKGVSVGFCEAMRDVPNAKMHNTETRRKANQVIAEKKLFEALLVDNEGYITEGSRSNVLFIKENTVFSAPEHDILQGIARKNVKRICIKNNIKFVERRIHKDDLSRMEALFLTGTSLKILPVTNLEFYTFSTSNTLLSRLMALYDKSIDDYIKNQG